MLYALCGTWRTRTKERIEQLVFRILYDLNLCRKPDESRGRLNTNSLDTFGFKKVLIHIICTKPYNQHPSIPILYKGLYLSSLAIPERNSPVPPFPRCSREPQVLSLLNQYSVTEPSDSINFQLTTSAPHNRH